MSYVGNRVWFIDENQIKIRNYENGSISHVGENTSIIYSFLGYLGEFVSTDSEHGSDIGMHEYPAEIPSNYHDALVCSVLERLYAKNPETIQIAEYWAGKFHQKTLEAKKASNDFRHGQGIFIRGEDF